MRDMDNSIQNIERVTSEQFGRMTRQVDKMEKDISDESQNCGIAGVFGE